MANIEGKDVLQFISTDNGVTFKRLTCLTQNGVSQSRSSTETDTKCGTIVSTGSTTAQFTGTGIMDDAPEADKLSYMDLLALFAADTEFIIVEQNVEGTIFTEGTGKITDISSDNGNGPANYSYTVKISGVITLADNS